MKKALYTLLLCILCGIQLGAQTVVNITDADIQAGQTVNWTKDKVYLLDGLVFVEAGATLNIEPGTVVKFTPKADVGNPSALIITVGAKINADGTADEPIIFTAEADDVNDPEDLGPKDNALWGGIVVLGNGITQRNGVSPVQVEGIPTSEPRGSYGGNDNADNSGVLRYVSIRHGGRQIAANNELNGLTLGGVGSGTTLEYVEIYANSDDGIEFFGGAPNLKYAVVAFTEDDSYDWDEVYSGKGQFWFSIQRDDVADTGGECDGSTPDDLLPSSNPTVYNWTHIGAGPGAAASNPVGWNLRAGTAGTLANCIVTEMKNKGLEVQDKAAGVNDAYKKLVDGELKIQNNLFYHIGSFTTLDATGTGIIRVSATAEDATAAALVSHLSTNKNAISDPGIQSISRTQDNNLDPRPTGNTAVTTDLAALPAGDPFFTSVNYKGAFSPFAAGLWIQGWSTLARNNHLKDLTNGGQLVFINDNSIKACDNVTWTKDNTYVVDGLTFVDSCATLTIEAGTVVKFTPRADVGNPSALVVARGAKIFANGTADEPIIFTAEADDVNDPEDLGPKDNSLWGGIVVLGRGITQRNGVSPVQVEGIPTTEPRGSYGGNDNADNSGVLRYVSIRHGGRQIAANNELNGLTLGGVGSGTTLEYIEIYANSDDGIEFFGGAPYLKYAVVAFAEDDCYDWDEVYAGKGQFWFSIQRDDVADTGGECDGSTPDDLTPYSNPTVYNWTHIGAGPGAAASNPVGWNLRAGTAGTIANSIVTEMKNKGLEVQDKAAGVNDAYKKLVDGELKIQNNIFYHIGSFTTIAKDGIIRVSGTAEDTEATALVNHLNGNQTSLFSPYIASISREQNNQLDPRPCPIGSAYTTARANLPAGDAFFTNVDYKGAFSSDWNNLWIRGWSTLARNNHLPANETACATTGADDPDNSLHNVLRIYPNPAQDMFVVESDLDAPVNVEIYDLSGRLMGQRMSLPNGVQKINIDTLPGGMYLIQFRTDDGQVATKKLIVE